MLKSGALGTAAPGTTAPGTAAPGTAAPGTTVAHEDTIEAEVEWMPWVLAAVAIAGASR